MAIKIIIGSAMIITGLLSELMGLFFYTMQSKTNTQIIVAAIFFIMGLILIVSGFGKFRSGMLLKPDLIKNGILKAAKKNNGEITKEKIIEETGWSKIIEFEINNMIERKDIKIDERDGIIYYIFPEFQPAKEPSE
jgi:putative Mn2+ efflux pump MntP